MKFKKITLLAGLLFSASSIFAQYAQDALRFSQTEQGTSSRFRALGGAQTALGGDISSIASNPAGLGLFTRSEIGFTPDFSNSNVSSQYLGTSSSVQKDRLGIDQFGIAIYNPVKRYVNGSSSIGSKSGWLSFNFGLGYNRTNNFNSTIDYSGNNPRSSFADHIANIATDPNDKLADAAYSSYLILLDDNRNVYYPITSPDNNQQNTIYQTGSQSEFNLSVGANYENRLYIGASLGINSINYTASRDFTENGLTLRREDIEAAGFTVPTTNNTEDYLDAGYNLSYRSDQTTEGSGINAKLGLIYRVSNNVRLGVNFISPTWYTINDSYSEGIDARYNKSDGSNESLTNDDEIYDTDYSLRTPYRLNGGLAITLNKFGLITSDIEYVDYNSINVSIGNDISTTISNNKDIKSNYKSAVNFRLGAEAKLPSNFMLRAGYNKIGSPYQNNTFSSEIYSGGLGYRTNNFYLDLTLTSLSTKTSTSPYEIFPNYIFYNSTGKGEIADIKDNRTNVFATIGFRF